jgi:tetratricopeptide (TPR) repeat protein
LVALLFMILASMPAAAQESSNPLLRRAIDAYLAGDLESASQALDSVPASAPRNDGAVAHLYRGLIAFARDSVASARGEFERAMEAVPSLRLDADLHSPARIELFESVRTALVERWQTEAGAAEERGDRSAALALWASVREAKPGDPDAVAAVARLAEGQESPPARQPSRVATDSPTVAPPRETTREAVSGGRSPVVAAALGLVVPGGGEFYANRPVQGFLVLAAAGGAAAAGYFVTRVDVDCRSVPVNGTCPAGDVLGENRKRPYLTAGVATAAAITLLGAIDAALGARNAGGRPGIDTSIDVGSDGRVHLTLLRIHR